MHRNSAFRAFVVVAGLSVAACSDGGGGDPPVDVNGWCNVCPGVWNTDLDATACTHIGAAAGCATAEMGTRTDNACGASSPPTTHPTCEVTGCVRDFDCAVR